jgi:hypothetical protein
MKKFLALAVVLSFVFAGTVNAEVKAPAPTATKTDNTVKAQQKETSKNVEKKAKKAKKKAAKPVTAKPVVGADNAAKTPAPVKK